VAIAQIPRKKTFCEAPRKEKVSGRRIEKRSLKFREKKHFVKHPKEKVSGRRNRKAIAQIPRKTFCEAPERKN